MKALILNGSPKGEKSNSLILADAFVKGMGITDISVCHLKDLEVQACTGCFGCWKATPGTCVIRDDAASVLELLLSADIVIWSFPLYYFSVPGLLKNMIDRQLPLLLPFMAERKDGIGNGSHQQRYDRSGQRQVLISTCGFYTAAGNYDAVLKMFDHMYGKDGYTYVFCGQGELFSIPQLKQQTGSYLKLVEQAGHEYLQGGITANTSALLEELIVPKTVFEEMADASWGIEKNPAASDRSVRRGLAFTKQMAALYRPESFDGKERVLEFHYTDLDEIYQIVMGKDGYQLLTEDFRNYTTRIETPFTVWNDISAGIIGGSEAMIKHLYRVTGDFNLMIQWDNFFYGGTGSSGSADTAAAGKAKKSKMLLMLIPWMVFWSATATDPLRGGIAGIVAAAAIPLLWIKFQATIYEYLSVFLVSLLSLAALQGIQTDYLIPASYGIFGLLWSVSLLLPVPLSALYSMYDYGGMKMLNNPVFIRTNRILTGCWGLWYLISPVCSIYLMQRGLSGWNDSISWLLPVLLGIFTFWFQRWYPRTVAAS